MKTRGAYHKAAGREAVCNGGGALGGVIKMKGERLSQKMFLIQGWTPYFSLLFSVFVLCLMRGRAAVSVSCDFQLLQIACHGFSFSLSCFLLLRVPHV